MGIDVNTFKPSIVSEKINNIVFIGRLIKNKGCDYLIEAFKRLPENLKATLTIVGDGPEKINLKSQANNHKDIKFLGLLTQNLIKELLNKAKVLCVPSIPVASGASEGLGLVFLEAQAMGVPVVSFNTGGIPEAVIHNKTGLLSTPNVETLASNISTLITNESLYRHFSGNAVKHVNSNFNIYLQTKKLEKIYDSVIRR